jgi:ELWxxDGT repeat protein
MVKDIVPGPGWASPICPRPVGSTLYFLANDGTHGYELWRTDGTEAGTVLIKDINPGAPGSDACVRDSDALGGFLYFRADDGVHGSELWKTDGTESGTMLVKDINPGNASASPFSLVVWQGSVYFAAIHASYGTELWRTDGTEAGTEMVRDIWPGVGSSGPSSLTAEPAALFFFATDQTMHANLWRTDGTAGGTTKVSTAVWRSTGQTTTAVLNGTLFFPGLDAVHGVELWRTDGSASGTSLVRDARIGGDSSPWFLTVAGGLLYFTADDGGGGRELWRSDGSEQGTVLVADLNPTGASSPRRLTTSGARLFFTAHTGSENALWFLDLYPAATGYYAVTPCRVFDTRVASGPTLGAPVICGTERRFAVAGQCGVPSSAKAVSLNLTETGSTAPGNLRLYAAGAATPLVSTLNYAVGITRANNAVVALGIEGQISVLCSPSGTAHAILDVNGYFE